MKKIEKLIIEYFEGNLNEIETKKLFSTIQANPELKKEFEKYQKLYETINNSKAVKVNQEYLDNILVKFRSSKSKRTVYLKPVFAGLMIVILFSLTFLLYNNLFINQDEIKSEFSELEDISSFEIDDLQKIGDLIEQDKLDDLLYMELVDNEINSQVLRNYFQLDNNYNYDVISEPVAEEIYNELITKKIL
jgi:hypothetical protein